MQKKKQQKKTMESTCSLSYNKHILVGILNWWDWRQRAKLPRKVEIDSTNMIGGYLMCNPFQIWCQKHFIYS
jgi:hypothetical protein